MIKCAITEKYGTVSCFCRHTGIPQSTIATALKKGVGGMGFETVTKILSALGLAVPDSVFEIPNDEIFPVVKSVAGLDEQGKYKIAETVASEGDK